MEVCFVLPGFSRTPIGGYKMVYEYANRLQKRGYRVTILSLNKSKMKQFHLPEFARKLAVNAVNKQQPEWFQLDKRIKKISGEEKNFIDKVGNVDVVFATGIQTVEVVKENFNKAKKFYLIQGYENWGVSEEYLHNTYNYGFCNITVSTWLKEIVDKYSLRPSILLKNPIDTKIYRPVNDQKHRKSHSIGLLYHTDEIKGVKYALEAIFKLKEKYEDLTVEMFGMFSRPENLPEWIHYKKSATQNETVEIYNKVQVFLCGTIEEGYGLTGVEAMACGACLVSTSYKGVLEYAQDGYNALLSPVKDVAGLVSNTSFLFNNTEKRVEISHNGIESVKKYSWDEAINKMCNCFSNS
jgi:glycosyltransferase involved in cell wall biosynthesis